MLKLFPLTLLVISLLGCDAKESDPSKSLSLSMTYRSGNGGSFLVTLKNHSDAKLDLMLNTSNVEGEFTVSDGKEKGTSFYDKDYLQLLLTSVWFSGRAELKPAAEIKWTVALDQLVYIGADAKAVTEHSLKGKTISLRLDRLDVIPSSGKSTVSVKAVSNAVKIP